MTQETFNHAFVFETIKALVHDLEELEHSLTFCQQTIEKFLTEQTAQFEIKQVNEEFAAWVLFRFHYDEERFYAFLHELLQEHTLMGDDLFGWVPPYRRDPEPEAKKILDRIDIALNYLKVVLQMDLPPVLKGTSRTGYSIRNGEFEAERCIGRTLIFVQAASDVFSGLAPSVAIDTKSNDSPHKHLHMPINNVPDK